VIAALLLVSSAATGQPAPSLELEAVTGLVVAGKLEAAESELRRIIEVGESAGARDLLGVVLARQGKGAEAEREFLRAVGLSPDFFPARQNLGRLYLQQGRAGEALQELQAAARLAPLERELAFQLAGLETSRGDVSAGEELFESLAMQHDSVRAMLELARSLARRGEGRRALGVLRHALDTAPNSEKVMSAYARLCVEAEAPVPAMETLEALTRIHPSVAEYWYLLGIARLQLAESDGAVEALRRSLELEPRQALPLLALGLSFRDQKRFAEAKEVLVRSLQLMPGNSEILVVLAEAEEGLGEIELAEQHVGRALQLSEGSPSALYVLGKIRMTQERYEEARDALKLSVEKNPRPRKAHYQLSLAYARLGDREASRRHRELYQKATKDAEELLIKMRTDAGLGVGGMGRGG
jgi:tetratricopeptide (TPR) repeat protein